MRAFHLFEPVSFDFFSRANFRTTQTVEINCTPQQLTEALSGVELWIEFVPAIKSVDWHGEKPFREGVRRTVEFGNHTVRETFFKWDEQKGIAFRVDEGTQKNVTAMAEHYEFEIVDPNTTRLVWTLAMQMTGIAGWLAPLVSWLAGRAMNGWLKNLKLMVETEVSEGIPTG